MTFIEIFKLTIVLWNCSPLSLKLGHSINNVYVYDFLLDTSGQYGHQVSFSQHTGSHTIGGPPYVAKLVYHSIS